MTRKSKPTIPSKKAVKASASKTPSMRAKRDGPVVEGEIVQNTVSLSLPVKSSDWQHGPGEKAKGKRAVVHDFTGYVVFMLPTNIRDTLGEVEFNKYVKDLEDCKVTAIRRGKATVSFLRMNCLTKVFTSSTPQSAPGKPAKTGKGRGNHGA